MNDKPLADRTSITGSRVQAIRWALAHTRSDDAYRPLFESFAHSVSERSGGELKIAYVDGNIPEGNGGEAAHKMVLSGAADIGQFEREIATYAPAITAPFAFRGYAHAEAVFNGPVCQKLLDGFYPVVNRKLRALAFTYSGGQRILFGAKPISKLEDFKGQRMESPGNQGWSILLDDLMKSVGVQLVPPAKASDLRGVDQREGVINRAPSELQRFAGAIPAELKYVNLTNHGLLVTAVVANEEFFSRLPESQRRLLNDEIQVLAAKERELSIGLERKRLKVLEAMGLTIVEFPDSERRKFRELAEVIFKRNPEVYRMIEEIRAVREEQVTASP